MIELETAAEVDAARVIVGAITAGRGGLNPRALIADELERLEPAATAAAAGAIVDKLVGDVSAFYRIDEELTIANLGGWVAISTPEEPG